MSGKSKFPETLVLLGCGKMGSAMLRGWLSSGLARDGVHVVDPYPTGWLKDQAARGLHLNQTLPDQAGICVLAVKPQMMGDALPQLVALGNGATVFLSIAAGTTIASLEAVLGARSPVIRAMPNTPAAIGRGITALVGNSHVDDTAMTLAETLMQAVGQTVRLDSEADMDAVTAVSGSGPAYVFYLIETLAAAGVAQGLSPDLALKLAKATVGGAGQLAEDASEDPARLRINVTSPAGTTAAALDVLMDGTSGLSPLMEKAVAAAANRGRELGKT